MFQIPDDQTSKIGLAEELSTRKLPPIYVISHQRAGSAKTLNTLPGCANEAVLVVAEEELAGYRSAYPGYNLVGIPAGYAGHPIGVGRAHQFVFDTAEFLGEDRVIILNDDLQSLYMLYATHPTEDKVSQAFKSYIRGTRSEYFRGVLGVFSSVADEAFQANPGCVVATVQSNNPDRHVKSTRVRYALNIGGPPAQLTYWDIPSVQRMGGMDLDRFNYHGDDISVACDIFLAGGNLVRVPSILSSWGDYETESVLRTPETAPKLRAEEHESLRLKPDPVGKYLKTRVDSSGRPKWHSLDYTAIKRDGLLPEKSVLWSDPPLS